MPKRSRQEPGVDQSVSRPVFLTAVRQRAESRRTEDRLWSVPLKRGSLEELKHARKLAANDARFSPCADENTRAKQQTLVKHLNDLVVAMEGDRAMDELILKLTDDSS